MEAGGRVIEGVLKERGEARQEYEQAIQAGHRAAITEQERQGVFTLRVGNVMPGEAATVRLKLVGPLPYCDGEATFRFPLVVAPRYIPGIPLPGASVGDGIAPDTAAVPDASRITPPVLLPGFPNPVALSLTVDVHPAELSLGELRSSLHAVVEEQQGGVRRIRLQPGERLDRDFLLRFRIGEASIQTSLLLQPDPAGNGPGGTFLLTLVPSLGLAKTQKPRDIVFILDRSGSMQGWKIVAARRALARMVDTLTEHDRFTVLAFDNNIETVPEFQGVGLVTATNRNRFRAVEFLARTEATGGTEMAQPLELGVRQLTAGAGDRERILVLVTDGQVGHEDQILRSLASGLRNVRIFALGIDQAVNASFLHRLAGLGGGTCELVESEDHLDAVMEHVHRRIGTAALMGLQIKPVELQLEPDTMTPTRLPDLFVGAPLCIMGRYRGEAEGGMAFQATDADEKPWKQTIQATQSANLAIAALWARGHLCDLEDRLVIGQRDLERRMVETSLRFGVLCRFTAFVAVDRSETLNTGGQLHQITQPVEMPGGWRATATYAASCRDRIEQRGLSQKATRFKQNAIRQFFMPKPVSLAQSPEERLSEGQLESLADLDPLTGLLNRRGLDLAAPAVNQSRTRYPSSLCLGFVDIDDFKDINTRHLFPGGDQVLMDLAKVLRACMRPIDTVGRIGGDEFLVIAPEIDVGGARVLGERIRKAVEEFSFSYTGQPIRMTVSIGFVVVDANSMADYGELKQIAAKALAEAKLRGRNCCVVLPFPQQPCTGENATQESPASVPRSKTGFWK